MAGELARALFAALAVATVAALHAAAHGPAPGDTTTPIEAFCIVVVEPLDDWRLVRVTVDEDPKVHPPEADFAAADQDQDGVLSPQEQDAWRLASLQFWPAGQGMGNRSLALEFAAPYEKFNPVRPVYAVTWRHVGHGLYEDPVSPHTGVARGDPVNRTQFETQAVREYAYQVTNESFSRVTLRGGTNVTALPIDAVGTPLPRPIVETVLVKAPAGWHVRQVKGYGYNATPFTRQADDAQVEIRGFDTSAPWEVEYVNPSLDAKLGDLGGPSVGPIVLALAVLATAWVVRRRQA